MESVVHNVRAVSSGRLLYRREVVPKHHRHWLRYAEDLGQFAQAKTLASLPGFCISWIA